MLSDLDELVLTVRDRTSQRLVGDAVSAYRGGAFRAAIVSTWIAVAYDIISKARELASQGESKPKQFVTRLDANIASRDTRSLQGMESELLQLAADEFQFFAPHEVVDLERLHQDRNLCAHPAFVTTDGLFQPSPEQTKAHIVHAVQHLLCHPPLQGKSALARFDVDIQSASFPMKAGDIEQYLKSRYLDRAKESLVVALAKGIIIAPLRGEHAKYIGKERALAMSLAVIGRAKTAIYEREVPPFVGKVIDDTKDDRLLAVVRMAAVDNRIWEWLSVASRQRIRTLVEKADGEQVKQFDLSDAMEVAELRPIFSARLDVLPVGEYQSIIAEHPRPEFIQKAIEYYGGAVSFRNAESLGATMIVPLAKQLSAANVSSVLDAVEANGQISHASGTAEVLNEVFDQTTAVLAQTGPRWRKFLANMVKGKQRTDHYAYPEIRRRLIEHGIMKK